MICLNCRRFIWNAALETPRTDSYCTCESVGLTPRPSLDGTTEATPAEVAWWWGEHGPGDTIAEEDPR